MNYEYEYLELDFGFDYSYLLEELKLNLEALDLESDAEIYIVRDYDYDTKMEVDYFPIIDYYFEEEEIPYQDVMRTSIMTAEEFLNEMTYLNEKYKKDKIINKDMIKILY